MKANNFLTKSVLCNLLLNIFFISLLAIIVLRNYGEINRDGYLYLDIVSKINEGSISIHDIENINWYLYAFTIHLISLAVNISNLLAANLLNLFFLAGTFFSSIKILKIIDPDNYKKDNKFFLKKCLIFILFILNYKYVFKYSILITRDLAASFFLVFCLTFILKNKYLSSISILISGIFRFEYLFYLILQLKFFSNKFIKYALLITTLMILVSLKIFFAFNYLHHLFMFSFYIYPLIFLFALFFNKKIVIKPLVNLLLLSLLNLIIIFIFFLNGNEVNDISSRYIIPSSISLFIICSYLCIPIITEKNK